MILNPNELHIWRYELDTTDYEREKVAPTLSIHEQLRRDEFLNEAEKIRYTCNHRFVRQVLSKYVMVHASQIELAYGRYGKPFLKHSNLFFNYSYRREFGLLAISKDSEVGIDIERIKILQDPPTFMAFSFSEKERQIISGMDKENFQDRLFTFWTFKEAIIKALGLGLNADLTKIDLSEFLFNASGPLNFDDGKLYTLRQIKAIEGYKAAYAIRGIIEKHTEYNYINLSALFNE